MLSKDEITEYARAACWADSGHKTFTYHDDGPPTGHPDDWPKGVDSELYTEKYAAQYIPKDKPSKKAAPESVNPLIDTFRKAIGNGDK